MIRIRRALVSVSDKTGIVDICKVLQTYGVEILSTGGTARLLLQQGIAVKEVADYTGFPEMLDGRVKTLHPAIHGGLLALRADPEHMRMLAEHRIGLIDMVIVNLYPFEKTVARPGTTREEAIENIDIGGPSMLRSAAKNHQSVVVISDPGQYGRIISELQEHKGAISEDTAKRCAVEVFRRTAEYDNAIFTYLQGAGPKADAAQGGALPQELRLQFIKAQDLRYGENPHQHAAFYADAGPRRGITGMQQLWGKELSFNNIFDLNAAVGLIREFEKPAVAFVKHNNPCGVAQDRDVLKAYASAWKCDQLSAFGGIVSINRPVDIRLAQRIARSGFLECIIAPAFSDEALATLKAKKNLRLLAFPDMLKTLPQMDIKRVNGGILVQDEDTILFDPAKLKVVTRKKPTKAQMGSLLFAWKVVKHVKSNAIVLAKGSRTIAVGAGQMSRVDSVYITKRKAGSLSAGSCLASDAFFPKDDNVAVAARMGVKAIIQPGGSIADEEIIRACDKHALAMVFTGTRHFKH
ncbi:MAG TPA: bifunctional phosphoribosylaminoimidazolecarboxamide formyltransferase/IMP cyclohydrolase [Candidatus Omnitrophota bacterium]|nr:bifunctional phosphoribosylaminoimidazolecarboxamide formyltransferase/IMP cyclohydrolase [Candidatus Omnitrophota bacterium]